MGHLANNYNPVVLNYMLLIIQRNLWVWRCQKCIIIYSSKKLWKKWDRINNSFSHLQKKNTQTFNHCLAYIGTVQMNWCTFTRLVYTFATLKKTCHFSLSFPSMTFGPSASTAFKSCKLYPIVFHSCPLSIVSATSMCYNHYLLILWLSPWFAITYSPSNESNLLKLQFRLSTSPVTSRSS